MAGPRVRVYVDAPLAPAATLPLSAQQCHYLHNVMRLRGGDPVHVFNGTQGEWLSRLSAGKRSACHLELEQQVRGQPAASHSVGLLFSPLKPKRMEFLVEKATELGVAHLHPTLMDRTSTAKMNMEKLQAWAIEAAEQSERLTVPAVHPPQRLAALMAAWDPSRPVLWAAERGESLSSLAGLLCEMEAAARATSAAGKTGPHDAPLLLAGAARDGVAGTGGGRAAEGPVGGGAAATQLPGGAAACAADGAGMAPVAGRAGALDVSVQCSSAAPVAVHHQQAAVPNNSCAGVTFLVGPEGGFSPAERTLLEGLGFVTPVTLGGSILRAETACLVCLALSQQLRLPQA